MIILISFTICRPNRSLLLLPLARRSSGAQTQNRNARQSASCSGGHRGPCDGEVDPPFQAWKFSSSVTQLSFAVIVVVLVLGLATHPGGCAGSAQRSAPPMSGGKPLLSEAEWVFFGAPAASPSPARSISRRRCALRTFWKASGPPSGAPPGRAEAALPKSTWTFAICDLASFEVLSVVETRRREP